MSSTSEKYELILRVFETKHAHVDYLPHDVKISLNERDAKTPPMGKSGIIEVKELTKTQKKDLFFLKKNADFDL